MRLVTYFHSTVWTCFQEISSKRSRACCFQSKPVFLRCHGNELGLVERDCCCRKGGERKKVVLMSIKAVGTGAPIYLAARIAQYLNSVDQWMGLRFVSLGFRIRAWWVRGRLWLFVTVAARVLWWCSAVVVISGGNEAALVVETFNGWLWYHVNLD